MWLQIFVISCILQSMCGNSISEVASSEIIQKAANCIVGGEEALDCGATYQCSFQTSGQHFCGCAVIDSKFVLTAGHCVNGVSTTDVKILVGTTDLTRGGTYYDVERLIPHDKYVKEEHKNDIALVKVNGTIEFNEKVQPIKLDEKEVPDGAEVRLNGWGILKVGGETSQKLQFVNLYVLQTERCRKTDMGKNIFDSQLCTQGSGRKGACNNDSGGPLVYDEKVVGVFNFGYVVCGVEPDVYAKVSYFYDWIKNHTSH